MFLRSTPFDGKQYASQLVDVIKHCEFMKDDKNVIEITPIALKQLHGICCSAAHGRNIANPSYEDQNLQHLLP